jgi:DNA helicase II / ATP-dependent DNA helicase PcrA
MKWSYPLNEEQRAIISHKHGPLLVVAGPGSGKTLSLILLAMNLLLCDEAKPSELILCTYTEKAACDMQDRLLKIASDVGYQQDLASLRIGTIHSICKQLITENKHYLRIEDDFITLDQFTRQLLIFEEIDKMCKPNMKRFFQKHWGAPWQMAKELGSSFDGSAPLAGEIGWKA